MATKPSSMCLSGVPLLTQVGKWFQYDFGVKGIRDGKANSVSPVGVHMEIQDTAELSHYVDVTKDGVIKSTTIYSDGGKDEPVVGTTQFAPDRVALVTKMLIDNEKACRTTAKK